MARRKYKRKRRVKRRRRRNSIRHKRASKKGWGRRKRGIKGYAKTRRKRGSVRVWGFPRHRNVNKAWMTGIAIGGATLLGAKILSGYVDKYLSKGGKNPLAVTAGNLTPVVVPIAASFLLMKYGNKIIKDQSTRSTVVTATGMAGVLMAIKMFIAPKLPAEVQDVEEKGEAENEGNNQSGYVRSMRGYRTTPMLESYRASKGMGAVRQQIPYGTGLPIVERNYNNFKWQGTLAKSIFED